MAITAFTSGAIIDATAIGKTVLTASSEGVAADAIGLGLSDSPTFADGTYTGTLTAQQGLLVNVGGSQKIYGVGTDGDLNSEYIETSWDGTTAKIQTKETGTGVLRKLDVLSGVTGMKAYANSTLILSSAWSSVTMNNVSVSLVAPTNGYVAVRKGDLRPYDTVTPINCGQPSVRWAGVYSVDGDFSGDVVMAANVDFTGLPTSDPLVAGRLWNDSGTMKISAG
jgi:hypothetical protein